MNDIELAGRFDFFERACPHYQRIQSDLISSVENLLNHVSTQPIRALEIGCGTGNTTAEYLLKVGRSRLMTIDIDAASCQITRDRFQDARNTDLEVICDDVFAFLSTQANASFDIIFTAFTLHNIANCKIGRVASEIYRCLCPNGIFATADKLAVQGSQHLENLREQLSIFTQSIRSEDDFQHYAYWVQHYIDDESPHLLLTEVAMRSHLERAGFATVSGGNRFLMDSILVAQKQD